MLTTTSPNTSTAIPMASCTDPLTGSLMAGLAYAEAKRLGTSTETDAQLLENYEERELASLGSADALLGEPQPRYLCSDIYMGAWNWRQNDMRERGEGPRCLLSSRPGSPAPLAWGEQYQIPADEQ